jgi:hypothetical protein
MCSGIFCVEVYLKVDVNLYVDIDEDIIFIG